MTTLFSNSVRFASAVLTAVFIIAFIGNISAQQNEFYSSSVQKQKLMLGNLVNGINSGNEGLRRSVIYFAGKYQVSELAEALAEKLNSETSHRNRTLILLSLYRIGGEECYKAIHEYLMNGSDIEARKLAQAMVNEYTVQDSESLSFGK